MSVVMRSADDNEETHEPFDLSSKLRNPAVVDYILRAMYAGVPLDLPAYANFGWVDVLIGAHYLDIDYLTHFAVNQIASQLNSDTVWHLWSFSSIPELQDVCLMYFRDSHTMLSHSANTPERVSMYMEMMCRAFPLEKSLVGEEETSTVILTTQGPDFFPTFMPVKDEYYHATGVCLDREEGTGYLVNNPVLESLLKNHDFDGQELDRCARPLVIVRVELPSRYIRVYQPNPESEDDSSLAIGLNHETMLQDLLGDQLSYAERKRLSCMIRDWDEGRVRFEVVWWSQGQKPQQTTQTHDLYGERMLNFVGQC